MTHPEALNHMDRAGVQSDRPSSHQDRANDLVSSREPAGWWRNWNPLWGWVLLGAGVALVAVLGSLLGGDRSYS